MDSIVYEFTPVKARNPSLYYLHLGLATLYISLRSKLKRTIPLGATLGQLPPFVHTKNSVLLTAHIRIAEDVVIACRTL